MSQAHVREIITAIVVIQLVVALVFITSENTWVYFLFVYNINKGNNEGYFKHLLRVYCIMECRVKPR